MPSPTCLPIMCAKPPKSSPQTKSTSPKFCLLKTARKSPALFSKRKSTASLGLPLKLSYCFPKGLLYLPAAGSDATDVSYVSDESFSVGVSPPPGCGAPPAGRAGVCGGSPPPSCFPPCGSLGPGGFPPEPSGPLSPEPFGPSGSVGSSGFPLFRSFSYRSYCLGFMPSVS